MSAADPSAGRVLFIQATEPAGYPPLIHASSLMAEAGWEVIFLSAPIAGNRLELPRHPRIAVRSIAERPSYVLGKASYARYVAAAARLALWRRPDVVYASDPLGAVDARDAVDRGLARATPRQRAALVLTALMGYPSEEAGRILGVRAATVRVLAKSARDTLRAALVEEEERDG